jgi:chemotaxis protein MotA
MLGIFLSYGFVGPIGTKMEHVAREQTDILKTVQAGLVSFAGGSPPAVALEFARKTIPSVHRPTAEQLEEIMKEAKKK